MHIDFKVTMWERIYIPKGQEEKIKELVKKGYITNGDDLYQWFVDNDEEQGQNLVTETLYDTSKHLTPEENDGENTIEAFLDNKIIYENGKDK